MYYDSGSVHPVPLGGAGSLEGSAPRWKHLWRFSWATPWGVPVGWSSSRGRTRWTGSLLLGTLEVRPLLNLDCQPSTRFPTRTRLPCRVTSIRLCITWAWLYVIYLNLYMSESRMTSGIKPSLALEPLSCLFVYLTRLATSTLVPWPGLVEPIAGCTRLNSKGAQSGEVRR